MVIEVQEKRPGESLDNIPCGHAHNPLPVEVSCKEPRLVPNFEQRPIRQPAIDNESDLPYTYTHISELKDWPQRLLHVPTLTSYEWTPGNVYNGVKEPAYNAISYTWGRWRLGDGERPDVGPALDIRGTPWRIPRINPSHFGPADMMAAIQTLCEEICHDRLALGSPDPGKIEFVWLDLACIDQRGGPVAAMEIGRQGPIFRRASLVGAWLSKAIKDESSWNFLGEFFDLVTVYHRNQRLRVGEVYECAPLLRCLRELLSDPWFSSLWTLQEAYLGFEIVVITASGRVLKWHKGAKAKRLLGLRLVASFVTRLKREHSESPCLSPEVQDLLEEVPILYARSGLRIVTDMRHERELLTCARNRTTTRDSDRIYGIMQIFGYQLGSSRRGCEHETYSLDELSDELGAALIRDYPLESQLFLLCTPAPAGKAWRFGSDAAVPARLRNTGMLMGIEVSRAIAQQQYSQVIPLQALLGTDTVDGRLYGKFSGRLCSWPSLSSVFRIMNDHGDIKSPIAGRRMGISAYHFYLDTNQIFTGVNPEWLDKDGVQDTILAQNEFATYLDDRFDKSRLAVLYLAVEEVSKLEAPLRFWRHYGLILLHVLDPEQQVYYWHRLGVLTWNYDVQDVDSYNVHLPPRWMTLLDGTNEHWTNSVGLYG